MHRGIKIGIITATIAVAIWLASPLFYERPVDEPLPVALDEFQEGLNYEQFAQMPDEQRQPLVEKMPDELKEMIMNKAATLERPVSESMGDIGTASAVTILQTGQFEGLLGHYASGTAKIIDVSGKKYLRFENFEVTNGPDLRVYLTKNGDVKNGLHLEKLKGSRGDQNYSLENIDATKYDTVVVYCQPFGIHFGQAKLSAA
ncbi:MAG: DM13 domain-containing protein [Candidatus Nitrosotenuis sp.]